MILRREGRGEAGEESQWREVFILRYEREGRKLKIKKSSKGMSGLKGCTTYAVYPRGSMIHTHKGLDFRKCSFKDMKPVSSSKYFHKNFFVCILCNNLGSKVLQESRVMNGLLPASCTVHTKQDHLLPICMYSCCLHGCFLDKPSFEPTL